MPEKPTVETVALQTDPVAAIRESFEDSQQTTVAIVEHIEAALSEFGEAELTETPVELNWIQLISVDWAAVRSATIALLNLHVNGGGELEEIPEHDHTISDDMFANLRHFQVVANRLRRFGVTFVDNTPQMGGIRRSGDSWILGEKLDPEMRERVGRIINNRIGMVVEHYPEIRDHAIDVINESRSFMSDPLDVIVLPVLAMNWDGDRLVPSLVIAYKPLNYDVLDTGGDMREQDYPYIENDPEKYTVIIHELDPSDLTHVMVQNMVEDDRFYYDIMNARIDMIPQETN